MPDRLTFTRHAVWLLPMLLALLLPASASAVTADIDTLNLTGHWAGLAALLVFVLAYGFIIAEEPLRMRKSMPALVAAGVIWLLVALAYIDQGQAATAEQVFRRGLEYYTELFLFLLAAMTYINAMSERGVFAALRRWLATRRWSLPAIYWTSGLLAFVISPFADNLTTALLLATVVVTVGAGQPRFVTLACINIVVAANAGGVFSPFGDITTLLVWQRGLIEFSQFFTLALPALVSWLVPASMLAFALPAGRPRGQPERLPLAEGGLVITLLFVVTIAIAVSFENSLHLPAALGMMTGLGLLKLYGYRLKRRGTRQNSGQLVGDIADDQGHAGRFDIFRSVERAEWDTLMFLFGILMAVAGLAAMGWLLLASELLYGRLDTNTANVLVGLLSGLVENVPVMFTVLSMRPEMAPDQWLLVTLTTGIGGSLLSIGSAAGVAVMGQARGVYTFLAHLKWSWAIALGYAAGIWVHLLLSSAAGV